MELLILGVLVVVLVETTVLLVRGGKKAFLGSGQRRKVYVDTSALMDPRLVAVAETGFLSDDLIIPRSVINELQLLADGKDHDKRIRARAGLDAVRALERVVYFETTILGDALDRTPVDNRLLELARENGGAILTNDFNLQKVAETEHIGVLNLNALALVMRNEYLPGERTKVKIVAAGSGAGQGVAYLKDGTMVVVDHAQSKLGEEVEVEFIRLNQTAAGTMMFAKLVNGGNAGNTGNAGNLGKKQGGQERETRKGQRKTLKTAGKSRRATVLKPRKSASSEDRLMEAIAERSRSRE